MGLAHLSSYIHTYTHEYITHAHIYLRNRKRVVCVYGVIMHAGNVRRIREKRVKPCKTRGVAE